MTRARAWPLAVVTTLGLACAPVQELVAYSTVDEAADGTSTGLGSGETGSWGSGDAPTLDESDTSTGEPSDPDVDDGVPGEDSTTDDPGSMCPALDPEATAQWSAWYGTQTVDGDDAEWGAWPALSLQDLNPETDRFEDIAPTSEDLSATLRVAWDEQHLYVLYVVTDDEVDPDGDPSEWENDGVEVLLEVPDLPDDVLQIFITAAGAIRLGGVDPRSVRSWPTRSSSRRATAWRRPCPGR